MEGLITKEHAALWSNLINNQERDGLFLGNYLILTDVKVPWLFLKLKIISPSHLKL